jgi:pentose-5-phosphate-3-epimerase
MAATGPAGGKVAASILSADFAYLAEPVKLMEKHVELFHK